MGVVHLDMTRAAIELAMRHGDVGVITRLDAVVKELDAAEKLPADIAAVINRLEGLKRENSRHYMCYDQGYDQAMQIAIGLLRGALGEEG